MSLEAFALPSSRLNGSALPADIECSEGRSHSAMLHQLSRDLGSSRHPERASGAGQKVPPCCDHAESVSAACSVDDHMHLGQVRSMP